MSTCIATGLPRLADLLHISFRHSQPLKFLGTPAVPCICIAATQLHTYQHIR